MSPCGCNPPTYVLLHFTLPSNFQTPATQAEAADEPLRLQSVAVPPSAAEALAECWRRQKGRSLYRSPEEFVELVKQV